MRPSSAVGSGQLLLEERDRPAPGEVGRLLVVASFRRVVVEGVLGAVIDIDGELLARRFAAPPCRRRCRH